MNDNKKIVSLLMFQSFLLCSNLGRIIINDTNDQNDLNFFFCFYQYMIHHMTDLFSVRYNKKINASDNIKNITHQDMYDMYKYTISFIRNKGNIYGTLEYNSMRTNY